MEGATVTVPPAGGVSAGAQPWPPVEVNAAGHLVLGGCDAVELARRFGTPLYVLDEEAVRGRCRAFRAALGPHGFAAYAGKAFLCTALARLVDQEGLHLDAVSGGEVYTALAAGFPAGRIILHGNNKSREELTYALRAGVGRIVVDNFHELDMLEELARAAGVRPRVLVRVAPGIEAHTHEYVSTGRRDSKFGFDLESGQALAAAERAARSEVLDWTGLHCHIGSQVFLVEPYRLAVSALVGLAAQVLARTGVAARELDVGGGFGVRYTAEDAPPRLEEFVAASLGALRSECAARGLAVPALIVEPGRSIVGEAGFTLYTVGAVKEVPGLRTYVAVDGGMADNPRPALYGARYTALPAARPLAEPAGEVCLVGRYCESGDVLVPRLLLPAVEPGDVVAVFTTGAYHYSMASNYNRFPRPATVLVARGSAEVIVERETFADLVARDRLPERLGPGGAAGA